MRQTTLLAAICIAGLVSGRALGLDINDISARERSATDFVDLKIGGQVPDGHLPGAVFEAPGAVMLLQAPDFYLEGSNRAWGFFGPGLARIKFERPMASVTIIGRGSAEGDETGPIFDNIVLSEAQGSVAALDANGDETAKVSLSNVSVRGKEASAVTFRAKGGISALELINTAKSPDSVVVISGIGVTPICRADITGPAGEPDGVVSTVDLLRLLAEFGSDCDALPDKSPCTADISGPDGEPDGRVDTIDLLALLGAFGDCLPPQPVAAPPNEPQVEPRAGGRLRPGTDS